MKPNKAIDTLSVEELIHRLGVRKIIPTRFSIDLPFAQVANALYAAYVAEVRRRHKEMILDDATKEHIRIAAEWLCDKNGKLGFMMTGLYGNGKTTLMQAMCNLINYLYDSSSSSERITITIKNAKDIAKMAIDKGKEELYLKLFNEELLAIDEVGEEPAEIIA